MALSTPAGSADLTHRNLDLRPTTVLGWLAVALAVLATVALTVRVLDDPSTDPAITTPAGNVLVEQGSIGAIEHRAEAQARAEAASRSVSEQGGIGAIEHRAGAADPVTRTAVEHGSPDAAEHRAAASPEG